MGRAITYSCAFLTFSNQRRQHAAEYLLETNGFFLRSLKAAAARHHAVHAGSNPPKQRSRANTKQQDKRWRYQVSKQAVVLVVAKMNKKQIGHITEQGDMKPIDKE